MCGIAGVVAGDGRVAAEAVAQMTSALAHRGPDGEGFRALDLPHGHLVLGHRRLAILDRTPAGAQPMANPETGDWIVYNGEIYNFQELRRELATAGVRFRSAGDTEVVLRAWGQWGEGCLDRFVGMFALALYDAVRGRLVLARDPLGIKPLYLVRGAQAVAFASELRALRRSGLAGTEIDRRALAGLLAYGSVPGPLTMLRDVRLLAPGSALAFDLTGPEPWRARPRERRFWSFPEPVTQPEPDLPRRIRERLTAAVRSHLVADVPVGVLLSSGLDSNAVTALAREVRGGDLDAFTVTLADDPEVDEGPLAAGVARELGIRFHPLSLTEPQVRTRAEEFLASVDQPTVDGLNTWVISQAVRERGIVVALSGLGGDEVFGGYRSFHEVPRLERWYRRTRWLPPSWRRRAAGWWYRRSSPARRAKAMELASEPRSLRSFCLRHRRLLSDRELAALGCNPESLDLDADFLPAECEPDLELAGRDPVGTVSVLESRFYMANTLLRDADVFGLAHGLEIRVPLLDRRVVELGYALPGQVRVVAGGPNKPVLVEALGGRLRPQLPGLAKRGFRLPLARWMRESLRDLAAARIATVRDSGLLAPAAVDAVWRSFLDHPGGPDWSRAWLLCVLGGWL